MKSASLQALNPNRAMAAMGRSVRVVLDSSILLDPSAARLGGGGVTAEVALRPGAEALLRRLRFSNLRVAICHPEGLPTNESGFLERTAKLYSFGYMPLTSPSGSNLLNELMLEWSGTNSCFYVTSGVHEGLLSELQNHNWAVIAIGNEDVIKNSGVIHISMLQELLITLATSIKKRGAFPIYPSKNDLIFVPLSFELPLASQLQEVDLVLHKITDEIIKIDPNSSISFPKRISFSPGMSEIIRFVEEHCDFCVIDPFKNIYPLLDRIQIQEILVRLEGLSAEGRPRLRAPCSLKVENFCGSELQKQLAEAKLSFPLIVKPQVACGVADAHNMALIFKIKEFSNLSVPLPAILQEYIDHGSKIFKFYAIGDKVFHAIKNSMPNASHLKSSSGGKPLTFNSLKTLPVATKEQLLQNEVQDSKLLDINLVEEAAKLLKELLGLTIFGFDVVVQESSGDHVIVDLNYLPSFKEVPDNVVMPAFWDAIKQSYESRKQMMQT
uniref:Inositol-tetrakisphosphate 1-kinase 6 n=1 Tax=Oryza glumipatula TaxID=40148 RepID=A0A0E0B5E8_9ORYZ